MLEGKVALVTGASRGIGRAVALELARQNWRVIVIARDLTPSIAAQLDTSRVVGMATDAGTRTSHSSILARSLKIPAVVSLGNLSEEVQTGDELILDGRSGRVRDALDLSKDGNRETAIRAVAYRWAQASPAVPPPGNRIALARDPDATQHRTS